MRARSNGKDKQMLSVKGGGEIKGDAFEQGFVCHRKNI